MRVGEKKSTHRRLKRNVRRSVECSVVIAVPSAWIQIIAERPYVLSG